MLKKQSQRGNINVRRGNINVRAITANLLTHAT